MSHQVCFTLGNCVPHGGAVLDSVVCATRYLSQKCLATSRLDCTRLLMLRTRVIFLLSAVDDAHQWLMMTFYGLRFVILCMYVGCLMGPTDGRPSTFTAPRLVSEWFPCVYEANSTWRWRQNFAQKLCPLCPTIKPSSMSYLANFAISWHIFIFSSYSLHNFSLTSRSLVVANSKLLQRCPLWRKTGRRSGRHWRGQARMLRSVITSDDHHLQQSYWRDRTWWSLIIYLSFIYHLWYFIFNHFHDFDVADSDCQLTFVPYGPAMTPQVLVLNRSATTGSLLGMHHNWRSPKIPPSVLEGDGNG
jgi:hypothetical protein